jgi:hypothetical protein
MGVTNGLSGYVAVVDANVETTHRTILNCCVSYLFLF